MRISETDALALLNMHTHGVLGTLHAERGVDLTPIVYATDGGYLGSPVDEVKLKSSLRLQRERNLEGDPRATLLIERWDRDDWSKLWWVRAELAWVGRDGAGKVDALAERLAASYTQYGDKPFAAVLVFEIVSATGWSQSPLTDGAGPLTDGAGPLTDGAGPLVMASRAAQAAGAKGDPA